MLYYHLYANCETLIADGLCNIENKGKLKNFIVILSQTRIFKTKIFEIVKEIFKCYASNIEISM